MLTEAQVERSFRKLVNVPEIDLEAIDRAEELLDELRAESPLRHRLGAELDEIRENCLSQS